MSVELNDEQVEFLVKICQAFDYFPQVYDDGYIVLAAEKVNNGIDTIKVYYGDDQDNVKDIIDIKRVGYSAVGHYEFKNFDDLIFAYGQRIQEYNEKRVAKGRPAYFTSEEIEMCHKVDLSRESQIGKNSSEMHLSRKIKRKI